MTVNILFAAKAESWDEYQAPLTAALAEKGVTANLTRDITPDEVDYIVYAPNSTVQDFTPYTRCKAVLNLWAGVENVVGNTTLTQPLARMVDHGLTQGMVEWVTGHTLRHHLGMDRHIHASGRGPARHRSGFGGAGIGLCLRDCGPRFRCDRLEPQPPHGGRPALPARRGGSD